MVNTLNKELISELLKLESDQQEQVLVYIKNMLITSEMNKRAELSEKDIAAGNTISMQDFEEDFEEWIARKKASIR